MEHGNGSWVTSLTGLNCKANLTVGMALTFGDILHEKLSRARGIWDPISNKIFLKR